MKLHSRALYMKYEAGISAVDRAKLPRFNVCSIVLIVNPEHFNPVPSCVR
jgi:hypothetical protein